MQLTELGLNRFLYRDNNFVSPDNVATSVMNNTSGGGPSAGPTPPPAGNIITGVILRSSDSDNRVEINPDDTLKAYNNKNVVLTIDKNGIVADNGTFVNLVATNATIQTETVTTSNVTTLNVSTMFNYAGVPMPVVYGGVVAANGIGLLLPTGWTSVRNSIGEYTITMSPTPNVCVAFAAPISGHFRYQVTRTGPSTFHFSWQQSAYISRLINVKQIPPGISTTYWVTVPGTYNGETPVDVAFNFMVLRYLP